MNPRVVLGIETSCDETAAALLIDGKVAADRTTRQLLHEQYGGVVPELASRAHEQLLAPAVNGVLKDTNLGVKDIEAIAVTCGPGLAGALLVGLAFAKGLAAARGIPYWGVNHIEGHLWSAGLTVEEIPLPFLALVVSGGHTLLIEVQGFGDYKRLGSTRDDAAGELFDKVGRMIGFAFPAGAAIDQAALDCKGVLVSFPRTRIADEPLTFSFSGLKTAVLYHLRKKYSQLPDGSFDLNDDRSSICAGLMDAVSDSLNAAIKTALQSHHYKALVVAGGVSASRWLRRGFEEIAGAAGVPLFIPPFHHCTDNGAMIAYAGYLSIRHGRPPSDLNQSVDPSASIFRSASL
jgi:N6-L-threonylcarbamoyladenine synthase